MTPPHTPARARASERYYLLSSTVRDKSDNTRKQDTGYWRPASPRTSSFSRRFKYLNIPVILRCDLSMKNNLVLYQHGPSDVIKMCSRTLPQAATALITLC